MIKRPFRNLKVPLVFGGQWKDHQTFQKWDPISKRLITVNCTCAVPAPAPAPAPPEPPAFYEFVRVASSGDPGTGNFSIIPISLPYVYLNVSLIDKNSYDTSILITALSTATTIKAQKNPSNYVLLTRLSNIDNTTYWEFTCSILSSVGIVNPGDTVVITAA
jgi:hypothetical protein